MKNMLEQEEIKTALELYHGNVFAAAKHLNCDRRTLYYYFERYPELAEFKRQCKFNAVEYVENKLMNKIENDDLTAIIFYLKTQGGWAENSINKNININQNMDFDIAKFNNPKLREKALELLEEINNASN